MATSGNAPPRRALGEHLRFDTSMQEGHNLKTQCCKLITAKTQRRKVTTFRLKIVALLELCFLRTHINFQAFLKQKFYIPK